jgi:lipid II isoglutaminyl synthase (glutamine-hydrolysing)
MTNQDFAAAPDLPTLRIAHLYPSLLNVAGDGGNVVALQFRAHARGIGSTVVDIGIGDYADFTAFDAVFFHGGQDVEMSVVADDLQNKAPSLRDAADAGVLVFGVCAGLQLLGHRYVPSAGPAMAGAGVLDLETRGGTVRYMQHAACDVTIDGDTATVVGFENHSGLTELGPDAAPFGIVIAGGGNNGVDGTEGARRDNVFATYLHGPVLPKNPWLTDHLLSLVMTRRTGEAFVPVPLDDGIEERNHQVAQDLAIANRGQRTALQPAQMGRSSGS